MKHEDITKKVIGASTDTVSASEIQKRRLKSAAIMAWCS